MKINLGDRVKDSVTGFAGIAVARTTWLNGCDRIAVQPEKLDKNGHPKEDRIFDEMQLQLIKAGVVKGTNMVPTAEVKTGGPRDDRSALRRN